jgi:D-beta-D-heptose 7-phosphate kinase/D-beta-D-heptose 1-phosphate adenosyltransferase
MKELMSIQQHKKYKILLIGDDCLDIYQYGTVDRISPEAPVPIFSFSHENTLPGMAANVKKNLENLGCDVDYLFDKTSNKTRIIDLRSKQQLLRIDNDCKSTPIDINSSCLSDYDAVVISDYDKGTVDYSLIKKITDTYRGPIFIDTKKVDLKSISNAFIKINYLEFKKLQTEPEDKDRLIVTNGRNGVIWNNQTIPSQDVEVADVTGAGDTFLSALTYMYIENRNDMKSAIDFAIKASSVTVQHIGVYAPTKEEIL